MLRIVDFIAFQTAPVFPDADNVDPSTIQRCFVPTSETREMCARVFRRLSSFPSRQPGAFLLTGKRGVGKTHLLRQMEYMLADPAHPSWSHLRDFLPEEGAPSQPLKVLRINVSSDTTLDLGSSLVGRMAGSQSENGFCNSEELDEAQFSELVVEAAATLASCSLGLLALDNISRRIENLHDRGRLESEIRLYRILSEVCSENGIQVLLVADESDIRQQHGISEPPPLEDLARSCDILWLSPQNIAEILSSSVARKGVQQRADLHKIFEQLRRRLPLLDFKAASFIELYPIHPQAFGILFELQKILPGFSPLEFAHRAIEVALEQPAEQLITLDVLFEHVLPQLRKDPACRPLINSYEKFSVRVMSEIKASVQPKAKALLAAIALTTFCPVLEASVKSLANALLLFDEMELAPSYGLAAALLQEMEQRGGAFLVAEGEKLDRRYRLLPEKAARPVSGYPESGGQPDDFRLQLPLMIYDWISGQIPAWRPEISPRYRHASQSLAVPYPGGTDGVNGLVYFKSIFDPPWSESDLATLQNYPCFWILLVLNPYERFYELDEALQKLPAAFSKIVIWRPDCPTSSETESLRLLSGFFHLPGQAESSDDSDSQAVRSESREILTNLYVTRGRFLTARGSCPAGGETLEGGLLQVLDAVLSSVPPGRHMPDARPSEPAGTGRRVAREEQERTLEWAAHLSGIADLRSLDPRTAAPRLREWYTASFEADCSLLSAGLHPLPDVLLSTRFQQNVLQYERFRELLNPILLRLFSGALELHEAMGLVRRQVNNDSAQLLSWKTLMGNLAALVRWLPMYRFYREYLNGTFPLSDAELDRKRVLLLELMDQPHRLLDPVEREWFERNYLEYKAAYIDHYHSLHQEALQIVGSAEKLVTKVDAAALRNLEALSGLRYTNQIYLHRVRIIGKWLQHSQCALPVREILDRYPRCFCNFNPDGDRHLTQAAEQTNAVVKEGLEYFRCVLRGCKRIIIEELKVSPTDEACSRQIAAILSNGPMLPLNQSSIEILNGIIDRHSGDFFAAIRSAKV